LKQYGLGDESIDYIKDIIGTVTAAHGITGIPNSIKNGFGIGPHEIDDLNGMRQSLYKYVDEYKKIQDHAENLIIDIFTDRESEQNSPK
jgi:hypothetical protein